MPSATVTVREIRNKETGIDITVPTHSEKKGLLQSTFEYNVVVVSRLAYFKSPKHKDTDVVQYMIPKKFADFEDLATKLTNKFPATVLPPLPKKALLVNDNVAKERRSSFDAFLKFLACTPKLSTSSPFLEFLGVNAIKAGKYRKEEDTATENPTDRTEEDSPTEQSRHSGLFDEEEDADELFSAEEEKDIIGFDDPSTQISLQTEETKLFADQDFGGAVDNDDDDLLFVPGSRETTKSEKVLPVHFMDDDNSDLLKIEDDLEKFLQVKPKPQEKQAAKDNERSSSQEAKPKPKLRTKPSLPVKPVPKGDKPNLKPKPVPPQKPSLPEKKKELSAPKEKALPAPEVEVAKYDTDNIMKYIEHIEQNTEQDDVDLFS